MGEEPARDGPEVAEGKDSREATRAFWLYGYPGFQRDFFPPVQGTKLFGDAPNALFLAAPRRTGKSTFLQQDLAPELERRGVAVVHLNLWADKTRDPGTLMAEAIGKAIDAHLGRIAKAAKTGWVCELRHVSCMRWPAHTTGVFPWSVAAKSSPRGCCPPSRCFPVPPPAR